MYVKVYYKEMNVLKEVRIFDLGEFPTFNEVVAHYVLNFPISSRPFKILWTDYEGDQVTIKSDKEFQYFCTRNKDLKCTVKVENGCTKDENEEAAAKHINIICDGCKMSNFPGFRYKCLECYNYDLCVNCENAGVHANHWMLRAPRPTKIAKDMKNLYGYLKQFICAPRYESRHDSDERNKNSHRHGSHYVFTGKGPCRASEESSGVDTGPTWVLEGAVQYMPTSLRLDTDVNYFSDNKTASHETEPNTNTADAFKKMDIQFSDDKTTEKKSNEKEPVNTTDCDPLTKDSTPVPMHISVSTPADIADDWTVVVKSLSPSSSSTSLSTSANIGATNDLETQVEPTAPQMQSPDENACAEVIIHHNNPKIEKAVNTLLFMGFSIDIAILTRLLEANDGNIDKVLDIIL